MEVEVVRYHNLPIGPVIKTAFFLQRTSCLLPLYGHASNGTYKSTNTYQYDTNHLAGKNLSLIKKKYAWPPPSVPILPSIVCTDLPLTCKFGYLVRHDGKKDCCRYWEVLSIDVYPDGSSVVHVLEVGSTVVRLDDKV